MNNEIQIGIYDIPKDCRAVILEGGRRIEIRKKKPFLKSLDDYRCKDCRHFVEGHATFSPRWTTIVCDAKPKRYSEAMQRIMEKKGYKDFQIFFAANTYGKPCEMFELKEVENDKMENR